MRAAVERARENLRKAVSDGVVQVEDVVVMSRDEDGKLEVRQGSTGIAPAAVSGAMVGGLIGLVFLAPLFGMAVGALGAGAAWKSMFGDAGVAQGFVEELSQNLTPGGGALLILVREMNLDEVISRIEERGHVVQTSLNEEVEAQLDAAYAAARGEGIGPALTDVAGASSFQPGAGREDQDASQAGDQRDVEGQLDGHQDPRCVRHGRNVAVADRAEGHDGVVQGVDAVERLGEGGRVRLGDRHVGEGEYDGRAAGERARRPPPLA